jgi:hypothetical protein
MAQAPPLTVPPFQAVSCRSHVPATSHNCEKPEGADHETDGGDDRKDHRENHPLGSRRHAAPLRRWTATDAGPFHSVWHRQCQTQRWRASMGSPATPVRQGQAVPVTCPSTGSPTVIRGHSRETQNAYGQGPPQVIRPWPGPLQAGVRLLPSRWTTSVTRRQIWNIGPEHRHAWTILEWPLPVLSAPRPLFPEPSEIEGLTSSEPLTDIGASFRVESPTARRAEPITLRDRLAGP